MAFTVAVQIIKVILLQPCSQGISSYCPLECTGKESLFAPGGSKMRDSGNRVDFINFVILKTCSVLL